MGSFRVNMDVDYAFQIPLSIQLEIKLIRNQFRKNRYLHRYLILEVLTVKELER